MTARLNQKWAASSGGWEGIVLVHYLICTSLPENQFCSTVWRLSSKFKERRHKGEFFQLGSLPETFSRCSQKNGNNNWKNSTSYRLRSYVQMCRQVAREIDRYTWTDIQTNRQIDRQIHLVALQLPRSKIKKTIERHRCTRSHKSTDIDEQAGWHRDRPTLSIRISGVDWFPSSGRCP